MHEVAFRHLKNEAADMSKTKDIVYNELSTQEYLKSPEISKERKLLLLKLRLKMTKIYANFGIEANCRLCNIGKSVQEHLTQCVSRNTQYERKVPIQTCLEMTSRI